MGFCPDGPWWPPSSTSMLWEMNVDSVSAFFLEALSMNLRHCCCLSSSYRLEAAEKPATPSESETDASDRGWLHNSCLEVWMKTSCPPAAVSCGRRTDCLLVIKYVWCKQTFRLIFSSVECFGGTEAKLGRQDWRRAGEGHNIVHVLFLGSCSFSWP